MEDGFAYLIDKNSRFLHPDPAYPANLALSVLQVSADILGGGKMVLDVERMI